MKTLATFVAILATAVAFPQFEEGGQESSLGIVNGARATLGQFPHQVLVEARSLRGGSICGGSIIDEETVVTAAHCVPDNAVSITVTAGILDRSDTSGGQSRQVDLSRVQVHPQYNKPAELENDLAILKVIQSFQFNDNVNKIDYCQSAPAEGTQCFASGWGTAGPNAGQGSASRYLQFVPMQYYQNNRCGAVQTGFCARATNGGGVCSGDSGGPFTCPNGSGNVCLLGVASYITNQCGVADGTDDVFSDVTKNTAFLNADSTDENTTPGDTDENTTPDDDDTDENTTPDGDDDDDDDEDDDDDDDDDNDRRRRRRRRCGPRCRRRRRRWWRRQFGGYSD